MRTYKPLRTRVIVKVMKGEELSKGGIILALEGSREDMAREEGVVLSIGKAAFSDTEGEDIKEGDLVVFARYAGKTLGKDSDGNELRVMQDIDICAIVEDEE